MKDCAAAESLHNIEAVEEEKKVALTIYGRTVRTREALDV
jgi:hypothetical protein